MKKLLLNIIILFSLSSFGQSLPTFKTKVFWEDKINIKDDINFGVGDDGINRIEEPIIKTSSELYNNNNSFKAENISDYNLATPWISSNKNSGIGESIEIIYDFKNRPNNQNAISINSFFIINGYRTNIKQWKNYARIKKLKMSINNKPFAYVLLKDTYKFQWIDFPDYWLKYGHTWAIKLEIIEVFNGNKYENTAISEIRFEGKYSENTNK